MIPVCYVFAFSEDKIPQAIKRFNCSLQSIVNQTDSIYILNASKQDISSDLFYDDKINYIHKPHPGYFNKSVLINFLIKNYINTNYFIFSDVDLVYDTNYVKKITSYIKGEPVRVLPRNLTMSFEYYSSKYDELLKRVNDSLQHPTGESRGNGLFHTESFLSIRGFNENFLGYGPEDLEFNERISKINEYIFDNTIKHIHLFHPPINREYVKQNDDLYNESKKLIEKNNIIRNNENWGEY
ncbi:MAG: galactosyltransferase-related protein [Bryobacteraceae bacterium]